MLVALVMTMLNILVHEKIRKKISVKTVYLIIISLF